VDSKKKTDKEIREIKLNELREAYFESIKRRRKDFTNG